MKVYFNNSCKICKAEIDLYKKEKCSEIDWVDITNNKVASEETNKSDKDLLRRLHVKEGAKIIGGAEAFLILWSKMPKYRFLFKFFKLPIIFYYFIKLLWMSNIIKSFIYSVYTKKYLNVFKLFK